jgi:hypothetical protein
MSSVEPLAALLNDLSNSISINANPNASPTYVISANQRSREMPATRPQFRAPMDQHDASRRNIVGFL